MPLGLLLAKLVFVTAVGTDVGKTFVTKSLLKTYANMGLRVSAFKPIETGVTSIPKDAFELFELCLQLNPSLQNISFESIAPQTFSLPASPFVARKKAPIDYFAINQKLDRLKKLSDVVIIEGAGGAFVPLDEKNDFRYFCNMAQKIILVLRDNLGTISDYTAYTIALQEYKEKLFSLVNIKNKQVFDEINMDFFKTKDVFYFPLDLQKIASLSIL